jgi:hypothetical protein
MQLTQCPLCKHVNPTNSHFCNACGAPLEAMLCPRCNAVNDVTAVMCCGCSGSLLEGRAEQEPNHAEPSAFLGATAQALDGYIRAGQAHDKPWQWTPSLGAISEYSVERLLARVVAASPAEARMPSSPVAGAGVWYRDAAGTLADPVPNFGLPAHLAGIGAINDVVDVGMSDFEDTRPALYGGTSYRAGEFVWDPRETAWSIETREDDPGLGLTEPPRVLRGPRGGMIVALAAFASAVLAGYVLLDSGRGDASPVLDGPAPSQAGGAEIAQSPSPGMDHDARSQLVSNTLPVIPQDIGPAPVPAAPTKTPDTPALRDSPTAVLTPPPPKAVALPTGKTAGSSKLAAKPTKLTSIKSTAKPAGPSGKQWVASAQRTAHAGKSNLPREGHAAINPRMVAPMASSSAPRPIKCTDSMMYNNPESCQR